MCGEGSEEAVFQPDLNNRALAGRRGARAGSKHSQQSDEYRQSPEVGRSVAHRRKWQLCGWNLRLGDWCGYLSAGAGPLGPGEQFGFGPPGNGQGARSWSPCKFLDREGWFKTALRPREGQDPHTARTAPPLPSLLPSRVGSQQIDELESRFVLSLAQLLAASWVTQAHQYQRKYSLECLTECL